MKNSTFYIIVIAFLAISWDEPKEILLWPQGAPGSEGKSGAEKVRIFTETGDHVVSGINRPSITPYIPAANLATGAAVIIAPGGGHRELWIDHEGYNPARWLQERGVAAFVLKYRLSKEENSPYTLEDHSLADITRAIRLVKSKAREWKIDTAKVGVMGFSAGGELAAWAAMRPAKGIPNAADLVDRESSRVAFQALVYPGGSSKFEVSKTSPSLFLVGGYNDRADIAEGMAQLYIKYKQAGIPAELHIYSKAGHGFGMRKTTGGAVAGWPQRLFEWLSDGGFVNSKSAASK
jgi:acetyl esterase/lipase